MHPANPARQHLGLRVWGLGFVRVWGLGFRVQVSGFRVWGLAFRVWGLAFSVWGSAIRIQCTPGWSIS